MKKISLLLAFALSFGVTFHALPMEQDSDREYSENLPQTPTPWGDIKNQIESAIIKYYQSCDQLANLKKKYNCRLENLHQQQNKNYSEDINKLITSYEKIFQTFLKLATLSSRCVKKLEETIELLKQIPIEAWWDSEKLLKRIETDIEELNYLVETQKSEGEKLIKTLELQKDLEKSQEKQ